MSRVVVLRALHVSSFGLPQDLAPKRTQLPIVQHLERRCCRDSQTDVRRLSHQTKPHAYEMAPAALLELEVEFEGADMMLLREGFGPLRGEQMISSALPV